MRTARLAAGLLFLGLCLNTGAVLAQVGIGTVTPNTHALLELRNTGTPRGLMLPKVATSQRTTLAASLNTYHRGMLVADTTIGTGGLFVWDGAVWQLVQTGVPTPLVWDRSGGNAFLVNGTDNVGIGTNAPATKVEIRQATGFPILQIGESATQGGQL
jgi:hypothetical protein